MLLTNIFLIILFKGVFSIPMQELNCGNITTDSTVEHLTIENQSSNSTYLNGSSVTFICRKGRLSPSNATKTCVNGKWIGVEPLCELTRCIVPKKLWHPVEPKSKQSLVVNNSLVEGTIIRINCPNRLGFDNINRLVCDSKGGWDPPLASICLNNDIEAMTCPIPIIKNGNFECVTLGCDKFTAGVTIVVNCNAGYRVRRPVRVRCSRLGPSGLPGWSSKMPQCSPDDSGTIWFDDDVKDDDGRSSSTTSSTELSITRLTIMVVVTTSVLGGLLLLLTSVLLCRCLIARTASTRSAGDVSGSSSQPTTRGRITDDVGGLNGPVYEPELGPSEDRVALIHPPSYDEVMGFGLANRLYSLTADDELAGLGDYRSGGGNRHNRNSRGGPRGSRGAPSGVGFMEPGLYENRGGSNRAAAVARHQRQQESDSVSRHSTQTSGSHGAALSGSVETMAVSDGTSVTLRTFESHGSNPSLGSTRPQTGSVGEPAHHAPTPGIVGPPPPYEAGRHPSLVSGGTGSSGGGAHKDGDSLSTKS